MTALKKFLLGLMLFGAVTYFGGGGTFASFSAETSNNGSTVASGTLTMSDTVTGGTLGACFSYNGSAINNVNPACEKTFALTNVAPGVFAGSAKITIANTGSLDASKFSFWASPPNATLSGPPVLSGGNVASLPITPLEGNIAAGDQVTVSDGTHAQIFTAAATLPNATSIAVTPVPAPTFTYPSGATVTDTSTATASNLDCFDVKTAAGTPFNFNPITGNPLCGALQIYVQEQTDSFNYCWLGLGSGSSPQASGGACVAPISVVLATTPVSGALTNGTPTNHLTVTPLNGNVNVGDQIVVASGSHTRTFSANAPAFIGSSSISVVSLDPLFSYPSGSTVTDTSSLGSLNALTGAKTLTSFDSINGALGSKVALPPLTANGQSDATAPVQLGHAGSSTPPDTRTFYVGVYLPSPSTGTQNQLQGLSSTFGITWHIDQ
jgi:hypothetical protein